MAGNLNVINVGLSEFVPALESAGVPYQNVLWKPPGQGDAELTEVLFRLFAAGGDSGAGFPVEEANKEALRRILSSRPVMRRVGPARELLPGFGEDTLLHAGPPVAWRDMCAPMRGAVIGALLYEGGVRSREEAEALMDGGRIACRTTYEFGVVAPMAGVVSPSMPLIEVENVTYGNCSYAPLNEGVGHVLRFGANHPPVIQRLRWLETVLGPALDGAVRHAGGIELKRLMAKALLMGDEMHQRNTAASLLFYQEVATALLSSCPSAALSDVVAFLSRDNEQFFLNIAMAAAKCALDPARNIPSCSIVTTMSRNGVDFGIMVSGLGDRWITAPSLFPRGLYFPGFDENDANPDMGDSAIIECYGLGGFAMAAAPTVARFLGAADLDEAVDFTLDMEHICVGSNPDFPVPALNFGGVPTGIDLVKVVATGILPVINSGVAHRREGVGQVGAGLATPPMEAMNKALRQFYQAVKESHGLQDA